MVLSTLLEIPLFALGLVFFSFSLWRSLKEDYPTEKIFILTLVLAGTGFLSWSIFRERAGSFGFWLAGAILVLVGTWALKKMEFKFFEFADGLAPSWFWLVFFFSLAGFFKDWKNFTGLFYPAAALLSLFTYRFLLVRYRRFSWYPSGKVGFAGFSSLGVYFVLQGAVVFYGNPVLSLDNTALFVAAGSVLLFLLFMFILYLRSGRAGAQRILKWRKQ